MVWTGALAVQTRVQEDGEERVAFSTAVQLDGDVVTTIGRDFASDAALGRLHTERVRARLRRLDEVRRTVGLVAGTAVAGVLGAGLLGVDLPANTAGALDLLGPWLVTLVLAGALGRFVAFLLRRAAATLRADGVRRAVGLVAKTCEVGVPLLGLLGVDLPADVWALLLPALVTLVLAGALGQLVASLLRRAAAALLRRLPGRFGPPRPDADAAPAAPQ